MDRRGGLKGLFISWLISISLLPVTLVAADMGLFGVRLCKEHRQVLACPYGTVIQFVDVIFSLTTAGPQLETCTGNALCKKPTTNDKIMHDMYDICIQQPACDVDYRRDWIACPGAQLFTANYTEIIYTCVKSDEFSKTLPKNRTNGRAVNYDMSAEDAALRPTTTTNAPPETPIPATHTTSIAASSSAPKSTKQPPIWKPVTNPPSRLINTESTIILAAVLAFVVFAFCCVACGFAYALKVGRIDKKKLPRCLIRSASELPPDHVYADIDYANMYPRGRFDSSATAETAATSPVETLVDDLANAGALHPQQLLRLPYLEFVDARGHVSPIPRTDPYYFVYDPAHRNGHRIVTPNANAYGGLHGNDPLFRSSSVVLQRHHFPHVVTPRQHHTQRRPHAYPDDPLHVPVTRLCGQQELPDLVHHESHHGSGSINACFSEHNSDPSGVILENEFVDDNIQDVCRESQLISASLPDVSAIKGPRQSTSSGSSLGGGDRAAGETMINGNLQTVVSRQVTIDSAFEDDYDNNTDESHSSNNHLAVDRATEKRFMMDSHEYLTPVSSASGRQPSEPPFNHHARVSQSPSLSPRVGGDIHKASTKRIRGGKCVALPPVSPSTTKTASTPCSPVTQGNGPMRGNPSRAHSRANRKSSKETSSRRREPKSAPTHRRESSSDTSLPLDVQRLENSAPTNRAQPVRAGSEINVALPSPTTSSNGLKFSPSVRV